MTLDPDRRFSQVLMHPILAKIGPFSIYSYGMMIALGFGLATFLMYHRAAGFGLDRDKVVDMTILVLVGGLIGARVLYVALHISEYLARPLDIIDLSQGGLIWYGGFLAGLTVFFLCARLYRISFWVLGDFIVPYVALAQSLGRIGCFLNGCCYGTEVSADHALGVVFPGSQTIHQPTQIYASLALLAIYVILRFWQDHRRFEGEVFLGYCMLYAVKRFVIEFLRGDNPRIWLGLTMSQLISVVIGMIALVIFINKADSWKRSTLRSR